MNEIAKNNSGELKQSLQDLLLLIDVLEGDDKNFTSALVEVYKELSEKVDRSVGFMEMCWSQAADFKLKAERFSKTAKTLQNAGDGAFDYVKAQMMANETKELVGDLWQLTLASSSPKLILDESLIPDKYKIQVTTFEIDKNRIKTDLLAGAEIPGARLEPVTRLLTKPRR